MTQVSSIALINLIIFCDTAPQLMIYLQMSENQGLTVEDTSGNALNGVLGIN